ncbi:DUF3662 and FHA domain-containing protein [Corynebacterium sp. NPDC060344]|uniref:DUF3662 and FHA domain-containing protein n=1 Tax=Corynebacterium sp. NPDC060344 TaxID=3347101 RepID=UPI00364C7DBF
MDFLGRIRKLDSSLQRGLDNGFARVFGGKVVPNELEECLKQEIEDFLMQDAEGRYLAPNDFRIGVSPKDFANLSAGGPELPSELADRMGRYCRNNGWSMSGSVSVRIQQVDALHTGQLKTASQFTEGFRDESGFIGEDGQAVSAGSRPSSLDDGPSTGSAPAHPQAASEQFGGDGAGDAGAAAGSAGAAGAGGAAAGAAAGAGVAGAAGGAGAGGAGAGSADASFVPGGASETEVRYRDPAEEYPAEPQAGATGSPNATNSPAGAYADEDFAAPDGVAGPSESKAPTTGDRPVQVPPGPSSPEEQQLTVMLLLQDGSNRTFEVKPGSNIIGRGTISDFRLPDTGVSRQHAEITWDGRDAVLVDLHSTNGTMVNDSPIDNWLLADGDVISMGHSVMEVRIR